MKNKPSITFHLYCCIAILFLGCISNQNEGEKRPKPNVIFIVTDDQGYGDVGFHGNTLIKTANLDDLAKSATELTNFHVGTTCTPSRAGLLTGRNANRSNTWHTVGGCSILNLEETTLAEVFQQNGYVTGHFGKWHLGDNYPYRPQDRGFDESLYHGGGGIGQTPDYWNNDYFDDTYLRNGVPEKFEGYCTDVWFAQAQNFMEESGQAPFFVYLAANAPHGPFNVPKEYLEIYEDADLTSTQKRFYGMITNLDDNIGKLIGYLKSSGQWENTIFIFTTDNGTAAGIANENGIQTGHNAGLRGTKGSHYDGGHRVPFLIHWPEGGISSQNLKKNNTLVSHVDVLPTLSSLCKLDTTPEKPLDGTDMSKVFVNNSVEDNRMLVVDTQRIQWPLKNRNSCVMQGEWRLVNGTELYNMETDFGQEVDLAEEHPEKVKTMKDFYEAWWQDTASDMHYAHIPISTKKGGSVVLTIHDLHTSDGIPWNQNMVRAGEKNPQGHYTISVEEAGDYELELRRYPLESELDNDDEVASERGTDHKDGWVFGKGIPVNGGRVTIGETEETVTNAQVVNRVRIPAFLEKGEYPLEANFILEDGTDFPAYYVNITKL